MLNLILIHCIAAVQPIALDIAWHESRFVESATNSTGDYGLFQLNHYWQNKRTPGVSRVELLDPDINVKLACNYLEMLYNKYHGKEEKWWTRYHSYRPAHRAKYASRVNKDRETLPKRARIHPKSDPIPVSKYPALYHHQEQTEKFCRERHSSNMLHFTVRYYAIRNHWDVLYRCDSGEI